MKKTEQTVKKATTTPKAKTTKPEIVNEMYVEVNGITYDVTNLQDKIKEAYKADGHQIARIKKIQTYINAAEGRAYYVINDKPENKFVEL